MKRSALKLKQNEVYLAKIAVICENMCMAANKTKDKTKDENSQDFFRDLVHQCIEAYRELMNTGMALDICRVQGKQRTFILRDPEFIRETKAIRAQSYKDELEDIEKIYSAASKLGDDDSYTGDDGRTEGKGRRKSQAGNDKDALTLQLKAASMRRELKSLSAEDTDSNEESTLNFFFTALTREEMEELKEVEVNHGTGDDSALMAMGSDGENTEDVASQAKKRNEKNKQLTSGQGFDIDSLTPQQREELLMALVAKEGQ